MTVASPAARVALGAAFLDQRKPGWRTGIDLDRLDIASTTRCILGLVFGDYWDGRDALGLSPDGSVSFGFVGSWDRYGEDGTSIDADSAELTEAWKALLSAPPAQDPTKRYYGEATLLHLLDAGVSADEFTAYVKVSKILSSM